ncbi:venom acid phosphatase Acph-1-like isoform X1 [Onthophagus taurus]|uniref:venom acid phosphatase Acph-1-like isoform X1 n=1 Tax=Onthophagus taurus TaxID=166361 RepID=UPI0039BEB542
MVKLISNLFFLFVLANLVCCYRRVPKTNTLKLVHVLFRHAQRTPDESTIYPNDPYKNVTYEPFGLGQLTSEGFKTQYRLGRMLRSRYGNFIGNYNSKVLKARSSPYSRTKVAIQLVLAGLFPPVDERDWNPNLKWQPIAFDTNPMETDLLFLPHNNCKNFLKLLNEYMQRGIINNDFPKLSKIADYLSFHSGWNVTSPLNAFLLYAGLLSEEEYGLELPEWTKEVYPDPLHSIAVDYVASIDKDDRLKTLSGGFLLDKILEEINLKINRSEEMDKTKISLLSGHDFNIIALLSTLGIYKPHLPTYAAFILVELHEIDDVLAVKVFYNDYTKKEPQPMILPGCETTLCPLNKFIEIYGKFVAKREMCFT